jgi:hypothetical protein
MPALRPCATLLVTMYMTAGPGTNNRPSAASKNTANEEVAIMQFFLG